MLLLCGVLRTDLSSARHAAECASANPRGLCVTKRGRDDAHLLLRCTACHSHRHDMGDWGDKKRGRHPRPCLGRNKPGGKYYHRAGDVRCFVPRLPSHHHREVVSLLCSTQADRRAGVSQYLRSERHELHVLRLQSADFTRSEELQHTERH